MVFVWENFVIQLLALAFIALIIVLLVRLIFKKIK